MNLRIPGPTPCPPEVLAAMARPVVDHRGPEIAEIVRGAGARLARAYGTEGEVLVLTTSGTGGLEAAVVNTLSPGDHVLAVIIGNFGDRFAQIAQAYGARVTKLAFEWGEAADPERIREALAEHGDVRAVLVTHNETSTGVTNPLAEMAATVRESEALLLVDGVSSVSSIPVKFDQWGIDVCVSGSQKGWMLPPGFAFVALSERAWAASAAARMPRFYFDLAKHRDAAAKGQTPWTPAVSLYFALDVALDLLEAEGWESVFARHQVCADLTRQGVRRLGLDLVPTDPRHASNTVTAVRMPEGVDVSRLRKTLREQFGTVVGGGQGQLSGKIIRIGHMGLVSEEDITSTLSVLEAALPIAGHAPVAV